MVRSVVRLVVAAVARLGCWQHAAAESAETTVLRTRKYHKGKVTLGGNLAMVQHGAGGDPGSRRVRLRLSRPIGWTPKPACDKATRHGAVGAHFRFGRFGAASDQLRYEIRILGVLTIRRLADVKQAAAVERAVSDLLKMVSFNPGKLYSDFNPSMQT